MDREQKRSQNDETISTNNILPCYMKFSQHVNFANFAIEKKSQNLSDAKIKCRENNMTRK